MNADEEREAAAAALEATGDYRVLRRLRTRLAPDPLPEGATVAAFVDVETTGLDRERSEVIELAVAKFAYDPATGEVLGVVDSRAWFRQPAAPVPPEITKITGISDADVAGRSIDPGEVARFVGRRLLVAHRAEFDRPFLEALLPDLAGLPWACSLTGVDWAAEGFESRSLGSIAAALGFFYGAHRALVDCHAGVEALSRRLPSGGTAMASLLASARRVTHRVVALDSPFAVKDELKARGYRWDQRCKTWWTEVDDPDAEVTWLRERVYKYPATPPVTRVTATNRFLEFRL